MESEGVKRKPTTILVADVEGSTRLMRADGEATLKTTGEIVQAFWPNEGRTARRLAMIQFLRFRFAAVMIIASLFTGCAADNSGRNSSIQAPASTVPPEYAAYVGTWAGKWDNAWPVEFTIWAVDPEIGGGSIRYSWKEDVGSKWSEKYGTYKIENGTLVMDVITIEIDDEDSNARIATGRFSEATRTAILTKIEARG